MKSKYRTARTAKRCFNCCRTINPGEKYYEYVSFPNDEHVDGAFDRPVRDYECHDCIAARIVLRGLSGLVEPQEAR